MKDLAIKIQNWIVEHLMPEHSRLMHFLYGFIVFELMTLLTTNIIAALLTLAVGVFKELVIDLIIKKSKFDWLDLLFTMLPSISILSLNI